MSLYRQCLKLQADWTVDKNQWFEKAAEVRAEWEAGLRETDPVRVEARLNGVRALLKSHAHPDPYIHPVGPDGSKWERNVPPTAELVANHS